MVYIYVTNIQSLPDPKEYPEIMQGLPEERQQKIMKFKQSKDRIQSLGAGLLLQQVLQKYEISMQNIRLGDGGKPEVEGICFNLSHSKDYAVCAVSGKNVGCDVEKIGDAPFRKIEQRFSENEVRYLSEIPEERQKEEFYRLWTMKESYLKMTGEGLRIPLNKFEMEFGAEVRVYRDGKCCNCHMKEYRIPGYKLAVCAEEAEFAEDVEYLQV